MMKNAKKNIQIILQHFKMQEANQKRNFAKRNRTE